MLRRLRETLIRRERRRLKSTTDNKPETKKNKDKSKLPEKELTLNTKTDRKLLELLWMLLPKLKKIHKKLLMQLDLLKLLITENLRTLKTKKIKKLKMRLKRKTLIGSKTKLPLSFKKLRKKPKTFNLLSIKLLTKKRKKISIKKNKRKKLKKPKKGENKL